MENTAKTGLETEQELRELNEQFEEFLHTKGIAAKFKAAFENMERSAQQQRETDRANFEAVKAQSEEDNREFAEFLRTKGVGAKYRLVIENIKKGAGSAPQDTAAQLAKLHARTQEAVTCANAHGAPHIKAGPESYTAASLADEFNAFLRSKGLDGKYTVSITEEE